MDFDIGKRLKELRLANSFSQKYVADKVNTSKSIICMYETNKRKPSRECLCKLADLYSVSIDSIVGREQCERNARSLKKFISDNFIREETDNEYKALPIIPIFENADDFINEIISDFANEELLFEKDDIDNLFILKINGDGKNKSYAFCESIEEIENNKTYVVNDNGLIKFVRGERITKKKRDSVLGMLRRVVALY